MNNEYYGTGRRKTSSARVFLKLGTGIIKINHYNINNYFNKKSIKSIILKPIKKLNLINELDLFITVKGGGVSGQAEAIRHGITKALIKLNQNFKKKLKKLGLVTRDSRKVERKKVGFKKSRCKPQFSKR